MASEVIGDEIELAVEALCWALRTRIFILVEGIFGSSELWSFDPALLVKKSSLLDFSNEIS